MTKEFFDGSFFKCVRLDDGEFSISATGCNGDPFIFRICTLKEIDELSQLLRMIARDMKREKDRR